MGARVRLLYCGKIIWAAAGRCPSSEGKSDVASDKAIVSGITGRYATALFDLAIEAGVLDSVEADLLKLNALLDESEDFAAFVASPLLGRADQVKAVAAVATSADLHALTGKFLGVLATNRRLNALVGIAGAFATLLAHHRGEVTAIVRSASALGAAQLKELEKQLKLATSSDVAIDASVDADLLGGMVVKVGSRMVDSSVKTKLDNLAVAMKGVQ